VRGTRRWFSDKSNTVKAVYTKRKRKKIEEREPNMVYNVSVGTTRRKRKQRGKGQVEETGQKKKSKRDVKLQTHRQLSGSGNPERVHLRGG